MKKILYWIVLIPMACRRDVPEANDNTFIFATWDVGRKPAIDAVIWNDGVSSLAPDEQFELIFPDGERASFALNNQSYQLQSTRNPAAGEELELRWMRKNGSVAIAHVQMPPAIENVILERDTLHVSQNESSSVEWEIASGAFEFALKLQCVESQPLPILNSPGSFNSNYGGPQVSSGIELDTDDFSFYGSHQITISVLNEPMVDVFFFDPSDIRGLLKNGPDNVDGGNGFIATISSHTVSLEIQ